MPKTPFEEEFKLAITAFCESLPVMAPAHYGEARGEV